MPIGIWLFIGALLFFRWRKERGFRRLERRQALNEKKLEKFPVVIFFTGTMGSGKNTTDTDIAMSYVVKFRNDALEIMLKYDYLFPYFPWINLERVIRLAVDRHIIFNWFTVREYIAKCRARWNDDPRDELLFNYDVAKYGYEKDTGLQLVNIWQAIEIYAQAYFLYSINISLIYSNFAIREDNVLCDEGNFPLWNVDFFRRSTRKSMAVSQFSHIIDFDAFRLGKKVMEFNEFADSLDFGVYVMSEVGKERGNQKDYDLIKKNKSLSIPEIRKEFFKHHNEDFWGHDEIYAEFERLEAKYQTNELALLVLFSDELII